MSSPAEMVRFAIVAAGAGVVPGAAGVPYPPIWPVYVGAMPDTPDNAACVYDTAGTVDGRNQRTGEVIIHPGFQVRVRAADHPTAYTQIRAIQKVLDAVRNLDVALDGNGYTIDAITQSGGILSLGQEPDVNRRNSFTLNGTITFREVPK